MTTQTRTTLKGYLVDPVAGNFGPVEVEQELNAYYQLLHCDLITIIYLPINGKEYCIIADDEGLLKKDPCISAVDESGHPMLVGALLITSAEDPDDTGEFVSLSHADILSISEKVTNWGFGEFCYPVVSIG